MCDMEPGVEFETQVLESREVFRVVVVAVGLALDDDWLDVVVGGAN